MPRSSTKRVVIVAFDGVELLDVTGPASVFGKAAALRPHAYEVILASLGGGPLVTSSGITLAGTRALRQLRGPVDTLLVAGGSEEALSAAVLSHDVGGWLRRRAPELRRIGSVCVGAFVLAASGLLDGRRATTHWRWCTALQQMFPTVRVEPDAVFTFDGGVFTSAGVTAGIDLSLALVERDLGRELSAEVARELVVFLRRPGGQAQFSAGLAAQAGACDRLAELIAWAVEHPEADLSVPALAARVAMSERNFARVFTREAGQTPARFVECARLDRARTYLEDSDWSLAQVAAKSGFGCVDSLQRSLKRHLKVTPAEYRERFSSANQRRR